MIKVSSLCKTFGGLQALGDVSIDVQPGSVHSVIGPNGAGKTTFINVVSGIYQPTFGSVSLEGRDITSMPAQKRAALGLTRTFQNLQVCMNMTAVDNVMVGAHLRLQHGLLVGMIAPARLRSRDGECRQEAVEAMRRVGLQAHTSADASQMSYGALKRLEIARALLARPRVLLLDEPAAGMNPRETQEIGTLIRDLAASGLTIVLVEHDMPLVMAVSDRITVMDYGRKIAEGSPQAVRNDPMVIAAYLGVAKPERQRADVPVELQ